MTQMLQLFGFIANINENSNLKTPIKKINHNICIRETNEKKSNNSNSNIYHSRKTLEYVEN